MSSVKSLEWNNPLFFTVECLFELFLISQPTNQVMVRSSNLVMSRLRSFIGQGQSKISMFYPFPKFCRDLLTSGWKASKSRAL